MKLLERGRTAAVLLGAQSWPHAGLKGGASFYRSAQGIKSYLLSSTGLGLKGEDILDLFDSEKSASEQLKAIGNFLAKRMLCSDAHKKSLTDIFIYYVGHGSFVENTNEFLMLVKNSDPNFDTECILARSLARRLRVDAPLLRQIVVLDCCFSGAAHRVWQNNSASEAAARNAASDMPGTGSVFLCSSAEELVSMAPENAETTMFTGALLDALETGIAQFQGDLTVRQARDLAWDAMRRRYHSKAVRPIVFALDRGDGDLSDKPAFPNASRETHNDSETAGKGSRNSKENFASGRTSNSSAAPLPSRHDKIISSNKLFIGLTFGVLLIAWNQYTTHDVQELSRAQKESAKATQGRAEQTTSAALNSKNTAERAIAGSPPVDRLIAPAKSAVAGDVSKPSQPRSEDSLDFPLSRKGNEIFVGNEIKEAEARWIADENATRLAWSQEEGTKYTALGSQKAASRQDIKQIEQVAPYSINLNLCPECQLNFVIYCVTPIRSKGDLKGLDIRHIFVRPFGDAIIRRGLAARAAYYQRYDNKVVAGMKQHIFHCAMFAQNR
jgi:hypothetical protein